MHMDVPLPQLLIPDSAHAMSIPGPMPHMVSSSVLDKMEGQEEGMCNAVLRVPWISDHTERVSHRMCILSPASGAVPVAYGSTQTHGATLRTE